MTYFEELCSKIQIIVSEVDGIITDGYTTVTESGMPLFKFFCLKDFEAINQIKRHFKFIFLSADNYINHNLMRSKNVAFYWAKTDKQKKLLEIIKRYEIKPENILYIGATYSDVECMRVVPFSICTNDAVSDVKEIAYDVLPIAAGEGVLCSVYNMLKSEIKLRKIKA